MTREAFDRLFPDCSETDRTLHQHFLVSGRTEEYGAVVTPVSFVRPLLDTRHRCSLRETLIGWASRQGLSISIVDGACSIYFSRELRKCLYAGCWEADLKSAQLAILAALAGSTKLQQFLENSGDWWAEMADHCGVDLESAKSVLKRATYAVVFGAGKRRVKRLLAAGDEESAGVGNQAADRFLEHPLVVELLECRSRLLKGIRQNGYMQDAFGADIRLERFSHRRSSEHRARSVLAWVAQSWELRIMTSIVRAVRGRRGIHIIAWIHDGCVLHLQGRPQAVETSRQELVRAVDDILREIEMETGLSICTRLVVEQLPPAVEQLATWEKQVASRTVTEHRSRRPVRTKAARALTGRPIMAFADRVRRAA